MSDWNRPSPAFPATIEEALSLQRAQAQGSATARPGFTPPASKFTTAEQRLEEARRLHTWADQNGGVISSASVAALEGVSEDGARLTCKACRHSWLIPTTHGPSETHLLCPRGQCNRLAVTDEGMNRPGQ